MKILIAGEDGPVRGRVEALFQREGYAVATAGTLGGAAAALCDAAFDALLVACDSGAGEILEWLIETAWPSRIPTVVLCRDGDVDTVLTSVVAGVRHLLLESDPREKLLVAIAAALRKSSAACSRKVPAPDSSGEVQVSEAELYEGLFEGRLAFVGEARQSGQLHLVLEESDGRNALRARERRAIEMLIAGRPLKAIAMDLGIALSSAWALIDAGRAKMRFRDRSELLMVISALAARAPESGPRASVH